VPLQRLGSPLGSSQMNDTQFYFALTHHNVKDHQWVWPEEVLELYSRNDIMLSPSLISLLHLLSLMPEHASLQRLKP